jgi:hypothetical protein
MGPAFAGGLLTHEKSHAAPASLLARDNNAPANAKSMFHGVTIAANPSAVKRA